METSIRREWRYPTESSRRSTSHVTNSTASGTTPSHPISSHRDALITPQALRGITSRPIECAAERGTVCAVLKRPRHEHAGGLAVTETCFISSHDPYNRQWRCASTGEAARRQARIVSLTKYFVRFC